MPPSSSSSRAPPPPPPPPKVPPPFLLSFHSSRIFFCKWVSVQKEGGGEAASSAEHFAKREFFPLTRKKTERGFWPPPPDDARLSEPGRTPLCCMLSLPPSLYCVTAQTLKTFQFSPPPPPLSKLMSHPPLFPSIPPLALLFSPNVPVSIAAWGRGSGRRRNFSN